MVHHNVHFKHSEKRKNDIIVAIFNFNVHKFKLPLLLFIELFIQMIIMVEGCFCFIVKLIASKIYHGPELKKKVMNVMRRTCIFESIPLPKYLPSSSFYIHMCVLGKTNSRADWFQP